MLALWVPHHASCIMGCLLSSLLLLLYYTTGSRPVRHPTSLLTICTAPNCADRTGRPGAYTRSHSHLSIGSGVRQLFLTILLYLRKRRTGFFFLEASRPLGLLGYFKTLGIEIFPGPSLWPRVLATFFLKTSVSQRLATPTPGH